MIRTCYVCGIRFREEKLRRVIVTTEDGDKYAIRSVGFKDGRDTKYLCNHCIFPFVMGAVTHAQVNNKDVIAAEQETKPGEFVS